MKKTRKRRAAALLLCAGLLTAPFSGVQLRVYAEDESSQVIANDESGIPDKVLYDAVLKEGDSNGDGVLTVEEAGKITAFGYNGKPGVEINNIKGINYLISVC